MSLNKEDIFNFQLRLNEKDLHVLAFTMKNGETVWSDVVLSKEKNFVVQIRERKIAVLSHGLVHNTENKPALIIGDSKYFMNRGKIHRTTGPAIIVDPEDLSLPLIRYYLDNQEYSYEKWNVLRHMYNSKTYKKLTDE